MPRFGVRQGEKIRAIDDAASSGHNTATFTYETISLPTVEFPVHVATYVLHVCESIGIEIPPLMLALDDIDAAYRRVPTSQPQYTVCAFYSRRLARVSFHIVYGHNFGLVSAVLNFSRVPALLCHFLVRFFAAWCTHYVDDYIEMDISRGTQPHAQRYVHRLHNILRFYLAPAKIVRPSFINKVLGVMCDLSMFHILCTVTLSPTPGRCTRILDMLRAILEEGSISPAKAKVLIGLLGFFLTTTFGKLGRAASQPIYAASTATTSSHLTYSMRHAIWFYQLLLPRLPPRTIHLNSRRLTPHFIIYSDASLSGMGFVIIDNSTTPFKVYFGSSLSIPLWVQSRLPGHGATAICQLEVLAALSVYLSAPHILMSQTYIIHFIDNTSAMAALIHGYSSRPEMALLTNLFHVATFNLSVTPWLEWVKSEANFADHPSRPNFTESTTWFWLRLHNAVQLPLILPTPSQWDNPSLVLHSK